MKRRVVVVLEMRFAISVRYSLAPEPKGSRSLRNLPAFQVAKATHKAGTLGGRYSSIDESILGARQIFKQV